MITQLLAVYVLQLLDKMLLSLLPTIYFVSLDGLLTSHLLRVFVPFFCLIV